MEVKNWLDQKVSTRIGIQYGNNPYGRDIGEHLRNDHGLDPERDIVTFAVSMDNHRAALIAGDITLEQVKAGGSITTPEEPTG